MKAAVSFRTESGDDYLFASCEKSPMLIAEDIVDQFGEEFAWAYTWQIVTDSDLDSIEVDRWIAKLHNEAQEGRYA